MIYFFPYDLAIEQIHSYSEVVFFEITFLEKLRKASLLKNLRNRWRNTEPLRVHV